MRGRLLIGFGTVFLLFFNISSFSQENTSDSKKPFYLGLRTGYGFVISHYETMRYLQKGHVPYFETFYETKLTGNKDYPTHYENAYYGIGFSWSDLGNPEQLGEAYALFSYVCLPLKKRKSFGLYWRFSGGIGYLTKKYNRYENPKNIAVGSKINMNIQSSFLFRKEFPKWILSSGLIFNHFSNGSLTLPNLGINLPILNIGGIYKIRDSHKSGIGNSGKIEKNNKHRIISYFGIKETYPIGGKKFSTFAIGNEFVLKSNKKSSWIGGADLFYSNAVKHMMNEETTYSNSLDPFQLGIFSGIELNIGRLELLMQMGVYAISKYKENGLVYNRSGARLKLSDKVILNLTLKSHYAKADYFEVGIGYQIK